MHNGLRFTKLPILKQNSSRLNVATVDIEKASRDVPGPGSEFQAMLAGYIERHPNYRDKQPQKYFETFRADISPDRMGFNPVGGSLLNILPTKPSVALQRKNSTNKFVTDEIELVSNIMKKANAEVPVSRSRPRLRAPKALRPSGESVNIQLNLSPQRNELKSNPNPNPLPNASRIPRYNTSSATNFKAFSKQPETSYYRGLHSSLYNKIRGRDVTIAPPRKSSPKRESFRPSAKVRPGMALNPFERLRVQKEFMARKIEEMEGSMVDTKDTTKAWILQNSRDKRVDASKILGHIIPSQRSLPPKAKSAQGQGQSQAQHQSQDKGQQQAQHQLQNPAQNRAHHHRDDTVKKMVQEVLKPLQTSKPDSEIPMETGKKAATPPPSLTEFGNEMPKVIGPYSRLQTVEEELRPETAKKYQNELKESGYSTSASEGSAPVTAVSVTKPIEEVETNEEPSPLGKLIDLDIYQKKVDMESVKFPRSSTTGKSKHTPVFLITKQGTLVRGAPLSAPKKATKKPMNPISLRKWTEIPSAKQLPGKVARLRNNQSSVQSKPKQLSNWDGQKMEVEQGDPDAAEVKAQLKTPPWSNQVQSEIVQPEPRPIEPPISEKFHDVLRRIKTLESRFDDMYEEMSALQEEKKIFESYLNKMEKVDQSEKKVPSSPSYANSTHGSESAVGTPESNRSIGDMSVSSTGDQVMTLEFLQTYDSIISIGKDDDDHDPTLWSEDEISSDRNVGTYIEEVYERTKTSKVQEARASQRQELLEDEVFHEDEIKEVDEDEDEGTEESEVLDSNASAPFIPNTASSTDPYEEEDEEDEEFTSASAESDTRDPNFSSQSTGNEDEDDEANSDETGSPLTPVQFENDHSERFQSWKPEFELDSEFQDRSEDYHGESEGSSEVTVVPKVTPFVERIYENQEFDYLYENQAPNPGSVTPDLLERKASQNELGDSLQLTLVNSQAFPFTTLERSVLGHLDELPESPEASTTNAFLTPCHTFQCKRSVSQMSVVSLPANLPLHLHTQSLQIQNPIP